jgi:hypothetical protein
MRRLDCSDSESTRHSLSEVLNVLPETLQCRILSFDFNKVSAGRPLDLGEALVQEVCGSDVSSAPTPDEIIWFHATRVQQEPQFAADGLLPLKTCLGKIENGIRDMALARGFTLKKCAPSFSYASKLGSLAKQGPCASLLREAAEKPGSEHCNFLDAPEIVVDICQHLFGNEADAVLEEYRNHTRPCVVSFVSRAVRGDVIGRALWYLHDCMLNKEERTFSNTCFDGHGIAVPSVDIVAVDWLRWLTHAR